MYIAVQPKPNIYIIGRPLLGIIFLVEFGLLVTDFRLVAIQATHMAHFNKSPAWLELIKLHEQTPPLPPP